MFPSKFARGRGASAAGGGHRFASGGGGGAVKRSGTGRRSTYLAASSSSRSGVQRRRVYPAGARRRGYIPRALVAQGVETKFLDSNLNSTALASQTSWAGCELNPATQLCFNSMVQGTSASQREGRKITNVSLEIVGTILQNAQAGQTAMDIAPTIMLALVLDTQTNGGTATGLDAENVYTNPSAVAVCNAAPLRNMNYSKRYRVLRTWTKNLTQLPAAVEGAGDIEQAGNTTPFKMFVKLGFVTEFLGNAGTVADISTNGLFLIGTTTHTSTAPTITYNARLRFRG